MKKIFVISFGLICLAVFLTILVWWYLQIIFKNSETKILKPATEIRSNVSNEEAITEPKDILSEDQEASGSIPLKDLPLSSNQIRALEAVGIEVETFVITPLMIDCVKEKISPERFAEIKSGVEPTLIEGASLLRCL